MHYLRAFMACFHSLQGDNRCHRISKMTSIKICEHCHISAWTVKHHISYFPEETIKLCFECHYVIHKCKSPIYDKYKKYSPGDSRLFYGKKHRKKHQSKYWLDLQRTRPTDGIAHKLFAKMFS